MKSDWSQGLTPELRETVERLARRQGIDPAEYLSQLILRDEAGLIDHAVPMQIDSLHPLAQAEVDERALNRLRSAQD